MPKQRLSKKTTYWLTILCFFTGILMLSRCTDVEVENSEKKVVSFKFLSSANEILDEDVEAIIHEETKSIEAVLPYGISRTSLIPAVVLSSGATQSALQGPVNFTNSVKFEVVAQNGSSVEYTITVTNKSYPGNKILSFQFSPSLNPSLSEVSSGIIDEEELTITVYVPCSMSLAGSLVPTIEISEDASVSPGNQVAKNFSSEVSYTVTSLLGETRTYTVNVMPETIDRTALVDLYNSNPGNWLDWDLNTPVETWSGVTMENCRVVELYLNEKKISVIPPSIGSLTKLEWLQIATNNIEQLPVEIGDLESLELLQATNNRLVTLPSEIKNLKKIESLILQNNLLISLPSEIGELSTLEGIDISANNITSLPAELVDLLQLRVLNANYNSISALPEGFGNLTKLEYVYLAWNDIAEIPTDIGNLTKLKDFIISNNKLTGLPAKIGDLTSLEELHIHNNEIVSLPSEIGGLQNLQQLYAYSNNLTVLPVEIGNLPNLFDLNLSSNNISEVPSQMGNLSSLLSLRLNNNELSNIPSELSLLSALRSFRLDGNDLTSVPSEFGNLYNLQYLYLQNNSLTSIPQPICDLRTNGTQVTVDAGVTCD